jgi:hypothetical protein
MRISNNILRVYRLAMLLFVLSGFESYADSPLLSKIEPGNITYTKESAEVRVSGTIDVTYKKDENLTSATVSISGGFIASEDELMVKDPHGIYSSWNQSAGTLKLSGKHPVKKYKEALRTIFYKNNESNPGSGVRVISFTVSDGDNASNTVTRNIVVQGADTVISPEPLIPTAVISGNDSICPDEMAELLVTLTGKAPWDIIVKYGDKLISIHNIITANYVLKVDKAGTYTLKSMNDARTKGKVSGLGVVTIYPTPTAVISGDTKICGESEAGLKVALTGILPWSYSYKLDNNAPLTVQNVRENTSSLSVNKAGTYTLVEVYDRHCRGRVSGSAEVTLSTPPVVEITGLQSEYSKESNEWVLLNGNPAGGEFSGTGVIPYENKWYFLPELAPVGINEIVYKYVADQNSCFGYDTATVKILEHGAEILFEDNRTKFCLNDPPVLITAKSLVNDNTGSFIISGGVGLTDHGNNTATLYPDQLMARTYTITYTISENNYITQEIEAGAAIKADFKWNTQCFEAGQPMTFTSTSSSPFGALNDAGYTWHINETGFSTNSPSQFTYAFAEPGNYTIGLQVVNSIGCSDTVQKVLPLKPVIKLAGQNYFENFENGTSEWLTGNAGSINSWTLGSGFAEAYSGVNAWYTNIVAGLVPKEQSWLLSPCFDFTGTAKPVLVTRLWRSFTDSRDAAYIQSSVDNGGSWTKLGDLNDGLNWYNGYYGNMESTLAGWTNIKDAGWIESRHSLDFLIGQPKVQFRIMYEASGNAIGNNGIAVDDIRIAERNRMVLIEHFTNSSVPSSMQADSSLDQIAGNFQKSIIDVQYHTSNPSDDPFYEDNPVIPTTRQFYYGLSKVPYAMINGGINSRQRIDYDATTLDDKKVMVESLYDSDYRIRVQSMVSDSMFYAECIITALKDIPLTEISLRIVVIENEINTITGTNGDNLFKNVVKTMLPGAAGSTFYRAWSKNDSLTVREKWHMDKVYNPDNLHAVAFIQNENTKEIYQAAPDTRGIITAVSDPPVIHGNRLFTLNPNPAQGYTTIMFDKEPMYELTLELYSSLGNLVYSSKIPRGRIRSEIITAPLQNGIYLVRISSNGQLLGTSKLVVSK